MSSAGWGTMTPISPDGNRKWNLPYRNCSEVYTDFDQVKKPPPKVNLEVKNSRSEQQLRNKWFSFLEILAIV